MSAGNGRSVSPRRLLRSHLGRRLLLLFIACALVPTIAVAVLSFRTVTRQLSRQAQERLAAVARAGGKTIQDRLTLLDSDLRREAPSLVRCRSGCGTSLLYAAEGIGLVTGGRLRELEGEVAPSGLGLRQIPALVPGQSAVFVAPAERGLGVYLAHRPGPRDDVVLVRVPADYLWNAADAEALPGTVVLALMEGPVAVLGSIPDSASEIRSAWSLKPVENLQLPRWRAVVSEPRSEVFAPISDFTRRFPLMLGIVLVGVVAISLIQIRQNLVPLRELVAGTRRVAAGDFLTPVATTGKDELTELGAAFNVMASRLGHQFRALETAAEIDRAILSSLDTSAIAQTVIQRIPQLCPCESAGLVIRSPEGNGAAHLWSASAAEGWMVAARLPVTLTQEDIVQANRQPEWLLLAENGSLPGYLAPVAGEEPAPGGVIACPLHHAGDWLGVLALRVHPERRSNDGLLELRRLADRLAVALANARMVDRVRVLAFYDTLTRLPNRILYRERLGRAIEQARLSSRRVGVCSLDLDHFGRINDTLGHGEGDRLLQEVGTRLLAVCRQEQEPSTTGAPSESAGVQVARLGGDEFAVILPDLDGIEEGLWTGRRLLTTLQHPFRLGAQEVCLTTSIGFAVFPEDGGDAETLHRHAGLALTHAKQEGRNTIEPYSAAMDARAVERMGLEQELRKAFERDEFTLWYQPIVDLRTRVVTGAEALVRWNHPTRGQIAPGEFIRLCEESGLIVPLGEWSFRTICEESRRWAAQGLGGLRFSVNLSARQLRQQGIVRTVQAILEETKAHPTDLLIELTESLLLEQGGVVERRIRELAELGLRLAIDDFGTGYSSLSYLKYFPISVVKIDRCFVEDVTSNDDAAAIATAIIALARAMDLEVVAEGIETREQAGFLRAKGCPKGQGYFLGRPMPVEAFSDLVQSGQRRRVSA
ncbi:MAG: putative bifunctional diguanylate cyclase/phosphodiesterase [Gemmatimonadales bacterium]